MSAFQPYAGDYQKGGVVVHWQCYATVRIEGVRYADGEPLPAAPQGKKWLRAAERDGQPAVTCLVEDVVEEFSQILLQIRTAPGEGHGDNPAPPVARLHGAT